MFRVEATASARRGGAAPRGREAGRAAQSRELSRFQELRPHSRPNVLNTGDPGQSS